MRHVLKAEPVRPGHSRRAGIETQLLNPFQQMPRCQYRADSGQFNTMPEIGRARRPVEHHRRLACQQQGQPCQGGRARGGQHHANPVLAVAVPLQKQPQRQSPLQYRAPVGRAVCIGLHQPLRMAAGLPQNDPRQIRGIRQFQQCSFSLRGPLRGSGRDIAGFFKQSGGGQHTIIHSQQGFQILHLVTGHIFQLHTQLRQRKTVNVQVLAKAHTAEQILRMDRRDSLFRHKRMDAFTQTGIHTSRIPLRRPRRTLGEGTGTAALPKVVGHKAAFFRFTIEPFLNILVERGDAGVAGEASGLLEMNADLPPRHQEYQVNRKTQRTHCEPPQGIRMAQGMAEGRAPHTACAHQHHAALGHSFQNKVHSPVAAQIFTSIPAQAPGGVNQHIITGIKGFGALLHGLQNSATRLSSFFADIRHKDRAQQSGKPPHQRPVRLVFVCQGARMKAPQTAVEQGRIHQGWMVGQEQNGLGVIHGAHFFQALYPNTVAE